VPHPSRWSDYIPPGDRVPDIGEAGIFFGAQVSWDGSRDHMMGTQDPETGLWSPGTDRLKANCPHCGNDPEKGRYCERCASVTAEDEPKLAAQRIAAKAKEEALERERRARAVAEKMERLAKRAKRAELRGPR
jgi:hypothetical protein